MSKITFPGPDVKIQTAAGNIDPVWYGKIKQVETLLNLFSEVNPATLTNGQVLIWNAAQKKFLPGAN